MFYLTFYVRWSYQDFPRTTGQVIVSFTLQSVDELVVRNFNYCVIDEVDSILIDEARTPLIISGPAEKPSDQYYKAAKVAAAFERDIHYTVRIEFCPISINQQDFSCCWKFSFN